MRTSAHLRSIVCAGLCLASFAAFGQGTEGVLREGSGARRTALNAMELKPFPSDLWAGVGAWANGTPMTSGEMSGKPVVIVSWQSWYDPSVRAIAAAQRVADQFASDGLIVVGLHDGQEWEGATDVAKGKGVTFRLAQDTDNKMRAALMIDQDPDIYVIDRAGQLRFADVDAAALEQAARIVSKETAEAAAKINETLAERARQEKIKAQSTAAINPQADLTSVPELPFPEPSPEAYANAGFAKMTDSQGREESVATLAIPPEGWLPGNKAPATKGRVLIAYLWNPDVPVSASLVKDMDLLQRERGRDVAVFGVVVTRGVLSGGSSSFQNEADQFQEVELLTRRTLAYATSNNLSHVITFDPSGTLVTFPSNSANQSATRAVVASSDGVVRWYGDPRSASFRAAVDSAVSRDPGVRARRAAEQTWLKSRGK